MANDRASAVSSRFRKGTLRHPHTLSVIWQAVKHVRVVAVLGVALACVSLARVPANQLNRPHNIVLFIPDGLRALAVDAAAAPALAAVRDRGVNFQDPHSLVPTVTTANASAMATGHYFGDTGNFANTLYA